MKSGGLASLHIYFQKFPSLIIYLFICIVWGHFKNINKNKVLTLVKGKKSFHFLIFFQGVVMVGKSWHHPDPEYCITVWVCVDSGYHCISDCILRTQSMRSNDQNVCVAWSWAMSVLCLVSNVPTLRGTHMVNAMGYIDRCRAYVGKFYILHVAPLVALLRLWIQCIIVHRHRMYMLLCHS